VDRVTNIAWKTESGVSLGGFAYGYDALGRVVSRSHSLGGESFDRVYSYDDCDRLASDGDVAYHYYLIGYSKFRFRADHSESQLTVTYGMKTIAANTQIPLKTL